MRKAAVRRFAEVGSANEIAAIMGRALLAEMSGYAKGADQKKLPEAVIAHLGPRHPAGLGKAPKS